MIGTIIIGFIIGVLAKFLYPGGQRLGIIMTTLLGIGGSMLASWVGQMMGWYAIGQPAGWVASTLGAVAILAIFANLRK
ncbi:transglycosylase [Eikenella sp. NML97-A-109]|uniref:GlsB/YeaQ/YmgE family stress response membrane protein n=1 Tax=Eikenella sp. NML97-A-109 TaxID=1795833 RepID=UPI0007E06775|nr:GlsB/YeaQ/YmgE family stress response membrane protein [Eikenella sp. NML97-A-109]OAM41927.1 transglycosylase [Eikenella sp. NML97-A-109]